MTTPKKEGTSLLYALIAEMRNYPDAISLGRGDPDFETPPHVVEAAKNAMVEHHAEYVPPEGILPLRQAISERVKRVNNIDCDPETEVVVTNGGQEGLFLMIMTALQPGDELIVPEPTYNTYHDALMFARGVKVPILTFPATNFRVDPADVRKAITEKTKAILLVSPNNPTAAVISPEDMQEFVRIAREHDLIILADNIYDVFIYDDFKHLSAAALPDGRDRTLTLNALSKSYSMTGWRLGWITGPADLMRRVKAIKAAISAGTSIIAQYGGLAALTGPQDQLEEMAAAYRRRRRIVLDALDEMGIRYGVPQGGQCVFADISFTGMESAEFAQKVLTEQHVLVYPGSAFDKGREQYIRITFLQPEEKLREGLEKMKTVMKGIVAAGV